MNRDALPDTFDVSFENLAPHARRGWCVFTLPAEFGEGKLALDNYGQAYSGLRRGAAREWHARLTMKPHERRVIKAKLSRLDGVMQSFGHKATLTDARQALDPNSLSVQLRTDEGWADVPLQVVVAHTNGPALDVDARGVLAGVVVDVHGRLWPEPGTLGDVLELEVRAVWSDPTDTRLVAALPSIRLVSAQPAVVLYEQNRTPGRREVLPDGRHVVTLAPAETWGDTQGQAWRVYVGLTPTLDAAAYSWGPIYGVASADAWAGLWGPSGAVPVCPPSLGGVAAHFQDVTAAHRALSAPASIWAAPRRLGLQPNSGQTGGQNDFGATKLARCWRVPYGTPAHLHEAYQAAMQEACRPGDWRNPDGSVAEPWEHPDHVTWDGYTHWSRSVSSDRMGKRDGTPGFTGNWRGPDREHWSNNTLCGTYLLTGSRALRAIIEKQARMFLRGETIDRRLSTSNAGAPRGIGRTLLAAAWIDCCLEAGELRDRFRERVVRRIVDVIEPQTRKPEGWAVVPVGTLNDPRAMPVECWAPWQVGLFILGVHAIHERMQNWTAGQVLDASTARSRCVDMLERTCRSWIDYGWWEDAQGLWLADYVATKDGAVPTIEDAVRREGFEEWMGGAARIAGLFAFNERLEKVRRIIEQIDDNATGVDAVEWRAVL